MPKYLGLRIAKACFSLQGVEKYNFKVKNYEKTVKNCNKMVKYALIFVKFEYFEENNYCFVVYLYLICI